MHRLLLTLFAAVLFAAPAGAQYIDHRPIRGVWLRPPPYQDLETQFEAFRDAGITDVYLETFYHGQATNFSFIFQRRYTFDYLLFAVKTGAKYNIRVHAWLETGYWGWQGSADYLLNGNPDWRVVNRFDSTSFGDNPGQDFVNLGNPGVQQMLADYSAELAAAPGLWGIQIDYHRMPLASSNTGPYSYDTWARNEFQSQFGVDPWTAADSQSDPYWDEFTDFRRDGISECANLMHQAVNAVEPGLDFSAAVFAQAMTSTSQLSKMQNWPEWAQNGYVETIVPMAYGPSFTSIRNDINLAQSQAAGAPVVAGLAYPGSTGHPTIATQLNAVENAGVDGFVIFAGAFMMQNPAQRTELKAWLDSNSPYQRADFDDNGYIDARDRALFDLAYTGTPVPVTGRNQRYDLDDSNTLDDTDLALFEAAFAEFCFGPTLNERDLEAIALTLTGSSSTGAVLHLHDLDGDGDVDADDRAILEGWIGIEPCPADLTTQGAGTGDPGFGVPDGQVTGADINYFVNAWVIGDGSIADVTTQGAGDGDPGFGTPDGQVTGADIQYYVNLWVAGCP